MLSTDSYCLMKPSAIPLVWNTVKYFSPSQILGKAVSTVRQTVGRRSVYGSFRTATISVDHEVPFLSHDPWNTRERILSGEFTFLNKTRSLGFPPNWFPTESTLWRYNLHYFSYLHFLEKDERIAVLTDWIDQTRGRDVAWDPYVVSVRLRNLLKYTWDSKTIVDSIYAQAKYLRNNLEWYLHGNHYLENAFALIFSAAAFRGTRESDEWYNKARWIIITQLRAQLLADGFHFEKSPMYHQILLSGLLDVLNVVQNDEEFSEILLDGASRMLNFSYLITSPDGRIPLFNDSTNEIPPHISQIADYARRLGVEVSADRNYYTETTPFEFLESLGYLTYKNRGMSAIFDFGSIGPDDIPAHAHSDIFTFELVLNGVPIVVDSGVSDYSDTLTRNYFRSTRAHNTVTVDRLDQSEMWGTFRVGRRFKPKNVRLVKSDTRFEFSGTFDGYAHLIGDNLIHSRVVRINPAENEIAVEDSVSGTGKHRVESYIHLNPQLEIQRRGNEVLLGFKGVRVSISFPNSDFDIRDGLHSPEFGKVLKNQVIVLTKENIPARILYLIKPLMA